MLSRSAAPEYAGEGTDVTIVSYAKMVHTSLQAAENLAAKGISAEVIDLRIAEAARRRGNPCVGAQNWPRHRGS